MKNYKFITLLLVLISLTAGVSAQTGGDFTITQSVIAGGGGQNSTNGDFSLDGTIGQSLAGGTLNGSPFAVTSGFWNFTPLAPTAAFVGVGGRVLTANGNGITNVRVTLTDQNGEVRTTQTSIGGNYKFDEVEVGETYIISVFARRFTFTQPTIVRAVFEETGDVNFIAEP